MKKELLFLYPYKFTDFEYFKLEIEKYKKLNYKVLINDLSEIISNKSLNKAWKSKDIFILHLSHNHIFSLSRRFVIKNRICDVLVRFFIIFNHH